MNLYLLLFHDYVFGIERGDSLNNQTGNTVISAGNVLMRAKIVIRARILIKAEIKEISRIIRRENWCRPK